MKFLFLLPILLVPIISPQDPAADESAPVTVVSFKWFRDHRVLQKTDNTVAAAPAEAVGPTSRSYERQRRTNDPAGVRDPNADTIDARSANLERITQEAREEKPPPVQGFTYQAKVQNTSNKAVRLVFWEYQFTEKANPGNTSRRQFVCRAKMKPAKTESLEIFSVSGPSSVVSVTSLKNKPSDSFAENVVINRVEYEDGSVWQRKGWNFEEVKLTLKPFADSTKLQPCRGL